MSTTVLEAVDLYRFYHTGEEETLALRGVILRVGRGEILAVLGPSGKWQIYSSRVLRGLG